MTRRARVQRVVRLAHHRRACPPPRARRRPRRLAAFAALALVALALAACAAAGRKSEAPMTSVSSDASAPPLAGRPDDLREQIRALDDAIARDLAASDLEAPDEATAAAMSATPVAEARTTCEPPPGDRCADVCRLSSSICDNATTICELAADLPGDAWASSRCDAAKASCRRATERCCSGQCTAP